MAAERIGGKVEMLVRGRSYDQDRDGGKEAEGMAMGFMAVGGCRDILYWNVPQLGGEEVDCGFYWEMGEEEHVVACR